VADPFLFRPPAIISQIYSHMPRRNSGEKSFDRLEELSSPLITDTVCLIYQPLPDFDVRVQSRLCLQTQMSPLIKLCPRLAVPRDSKWSDSIPLVSFKNYSTPGPVPPNTPPPRLFLTAEWSPQDQSAVVASPPRSQPPFSPENFAT